MSARVRNFARQELHRNLHIRHSGTVETSLAALATATASSSILDRPASRDSKRQDQFKEDGS